MIIGITGYAGSGKDTLGKAIQYVTATYPIPEFLNLKGALNVAHKAGTPWKVMKFADGVREVASILAPRIGLVTQEDKAKLMPPEWNMFGMPMTVREFLQRIGTDAMRNGLHPHVWVNMLMSKYVPAGFGMAGFNYPNWIITDVRFPNEVAAIKQKDGIIVKITRPGVAVSSHVSESYIADIEADVHVNNSFTELELIEEANKIITYVKERTARHDRRP
jgi:hypothetical protein